MQDQTAQRIDIPRASQAGLAQSGLGQRELAEEKFRQELTLDLNHLWAQMELGRLATTEKNTE